MIHSENCQSKYCLYLQTCFVLLSSSSDGAYFHSSTKRTVQRTQTTHTATQTAVRAFTFCFLKGRLFHLNLSSSLFGCSSCTGTLWLHQSRGVRHLQLIARCPSLGHSVDLTTHLQSKYLESTGHTYLCWSLLCSVLLFFAVECGEERTD